MPHKRNPILSERIAGLARLLRGYAQTALENQPLWHERDISHSQRRAGDPARRDDPARLHARADDRADRGTRGPLRSACARTSSAASGSTPRRASCVALVEQAGLAREEAYAIVQRAAAARRRRARAAARPPGARSGGRPQLSLDRPRRLLRRRDASCATSPRSSRGSTRSLPSAPRRTPTRRRSTPMLTADPFVRSGKVRDLYALDDERLLLVASDRISAFDVVLPTAIPDKGRVLTGLSRFWFARDGRIVPNHLLGTDLERRPDATIGRGSTRRSAGRSMVVPARRAWSPVEAVVRGYLAGSGWKEYRATGTCAASRSRRPARERPTARADLHAGDQGERRRPRREHRLRRRWSTTSRTGRSAAGDGAGRRSPRRSAITPCGLYSLHGSAVAARAGILLADTKFEFGLVRGRHRRRIAADTLILVDEALTPDSSRFWDAATYEPGRAQASYDKQFVRDWLEAQAWDKTAARPGAPRRRRRRARGRATSRPSSGSPARASSATSRRTSSPDEQPPVRRQRHARSPASSTRRAGPSRAASVTSASRACRAVRVGRRVELTVEAGDEAAARAVVERLASELLSNPLIEAYADRWASSSAERSP